MKRMDYRNPNDFIGKRFGALALLKPIKRGSRTYFECLCDCGNHTTAPFGSLNDLCLRSCGCKRSHHNRLPPGCAAFNAVSRSYASSAKAKNLEFSLTKEQLLNLFSGKCKYCGGAPSRTYKRPYPSGIKHPFLYNGIDRIDNEKGYVIENVASCCSQCNYMKGSLSIIDWEIIQSHMEKIAARRASNPKSLTPKSITGNGLRGSFKIAN